MRVARKQPSARLSTRPRWASTASRRPRGSGATRHAAARSSQPLAPSPIRSSSWSWTATKTACECRKPLMRRRTSMTSEDSPPRRVDRRLDRASPSPPSALPSRPSPEVFVRRSPTCRGVTSLGPSFSGPSRDLPGAPDLLSRASSPVGPGRRLLPGSPLGLLNDARPPHVHV
jgi:hypothetical protein